MNDVVFKLVLGSNTEDSREALRSLLSGKTDMESLTLEEIIRDFDKV